MTLLLKTNVVSEKKHRTEENIFIINTIYQKYVHKEGKRLYMAFADLRKYLDTINRELLLYSLIDCYITGNIYNTLNICMLIVNVILEIIMVYQSHLAVIVVLFKDIILVLP